MNKPRFKPGDIITSLDHTGVTRQIVDVRATGYGWKYPDMGQMTPSGEQNYWWSENSSDPFLERWKRVEGKTDG